MYRLTPRMLQHFEQGLRKFHALFSSGRCLGWQQEELIAGAIKADTQAQHHVFWKEGGHDDEADIRVRTNGDMHLLQVKSGKVAGGKLTLSGHRLGRFNGDLRRITDYLNANSANILTVPYEKTDDANGITHAYTVSYVDVHHLTGLRADKWEKVGASYKQTNADGVEFTLSPSMSWQVWWRIPLSLVEESPTISIR